MTIRLLAALALASGMAAGYGCSGDARSRGDRTGVYSTTYSASDATFAKQAAAINMEEVILGRLAEQRAVSEDVRMYGRMLASDHTISQNELKSLASDQGLLLPTSLPEEQQRDVDRLRLLSGEEFDRAFMTHMVGGHRKAIDLYSDFARTGSNERLKGYARAQIPSLQTHLAKAKDLADKVGATFAFESAWMRDQADRVQ